MGILQLGGVILASGRLYAGVHDGVGASGSADDRVREASRQADRAQLRLGRQSSPLDRRHQGPYRL